LRPQVGERKAPKHHIFFLPLQRKGRVMVDREVSWETVPFSPRLVGFRPAGVEGAAAWDSELEVFLLAVDPEWLGTSNSNAIRDAWVRRSPNVIRSHRLESMLRELLEEVEAPGTLSDQYAESLVRMICIHVARVLDADGDAAAGRRIPPARLRRVFEYIDVHLPEELSLDDLARVAEMSVRHFCRCFRAETGRTPRRYILQARVERAKRLMGRPGASLAQVAFESGFATQAHFTHVFRRFTGQIPARFRTRQ
jgi:AraC family transcriptional regulator